MTVTTITDAELTPKDYASDQEVRWCPGCGDYAILKAVQKAGAPPHLLVRRVVLGGELGVGPGGSVVPRLRGLCDPQGRPESPGGARRAARAHRVRIVPAAGA